ncbi:MAG: nuclear transport factor 2 family protein [Hyphomicrobium sp.]|nr:nuclear transport factor 2 family protein [Hyphomicrobium sp.]
MRRLMSIRVLFAVLVATSLVSGHPAAADTGRDVEDLYRRFATAQNARDLDAVRALLWDQPQFLWISDGKPFWGREAMLMRMASFQEAEIWRVEPDYASSEVIEVGLDAAYLHIPLVLVLGSNDKPAHLKWLVEVLCRRTETGWRIAALFTTEDKRP